MEQLILAALRAFGAMSPNEVKQKFDDKGESFSLEYFSRLMMEMEKNELIFLLPDAKFSLYPPVVTAKSRW